MNRQFVALIKRKYRPKGERTEEAQALVEFALAMPVLLLIVFGVMAFGHLFFTYIIGVSASREAVRYGATVGNSVNGIPRYQDCTEIRNAAVRAGSMVNVNPANVAAFYDHGPGTSIFFVCGGAGLPSVALGDRINVTVTVNYTPFIPLVQMPTIPIVVTSSRSVVKDLYVGTPVPLEP